MTNEVREGLWQCAIRKLEARHDPELDEIALFFRTVDWHSEWCGLVYPEKWGYPQADPILRP